jgi:hypothetical protein
LAQFLISLVFFILVLACLWGVLHWVRYKKRENTCICGKGACLTDKTRDAKDSPSHPAGSHDAAADCQCDE